MEKLEGYGSSIDKVEKVNDTLKDTIDRLCQKYFEFEHQLKRGCHSRSTTLISENKKLLDDINLECGKLSDKVSLLEGRLKEKESEPETDDQLIAIEQVKKTIMGVKSRLKEIIEEVEQEKQKLFESQDLHTQNEAKIEEKG
mmetsp:Transcript_9285/g.8739  ORF Transcript_9285/g.8739 Transcript_9285/m.8739 type:complete len:142 (+) Transcript_9285:1409-1834(+)